MKDLKFIVIITVFFITMSSTNLFAQGRQTRTSSAKAAYGYPTEYNSKKKKKKKQPRKAPKRKKKTPISKQKSPWVN